MKLEDNQVAMRQDTGAIRTPHLLQRHGHHEWSRRQFLHAGGLLLGTLAAGLTLGQERVLAAPSGCGTPSQLPDFSPVMYDFFGLEVPWFTPAEVDPFTGVFDPVANPTTIWDFNGSFGLIDADGVSDPDHDSEGVARRWACDVRFMSGVFRDRAGRTQQGTFCFL
jgi:hypothetical protein